MVTPRRIDVVLDSVKRLLRIGATANLLNLLQKQHPADLAQIFGSLLDTERSAVFTLLVERNRGWRWRRSARWGRSRAPSCSPGRSAEEIAKLLQELPSDDAAALIDYLPEELSQRSPRTDAPARVGAGGKPARVRRADRRPHHEPEVFALNEDLTVGEAITALQSSRDVEMVFYLYVVDVSAATWSASPRCGACCWSHPRRR